MLWALNGNLVREGNWIGVDFHVYYAAALALRQGQDIYTAGIAPPYVYPPLLAALVIPLSALPVTTATILWKLSQNVFLLIAGALLVSMVAKHIRPLAGGILLLGLLTAPVHDEIQVGESNSLVLALIVGAVWLIDRYEDKEKEESPGDGSRIWIAASAGFLLALAAGIKVLPVLLIAYLWWRGPRLVAAIATGIFVALQLLMLALTPSTADYWLVQFPGLFGQAFPYLDNQSLNAFISRATLPGGDPGMPNMQLFDGEAIRPVLTWLANLIALGAAIWALWATSRRAAPDPASRTMGLMLRIALVLLTIHLVSGSTWLHHLLDLSLPIAALLALAAMAKPGGLKERLSSLWAGILLLVLTFLILIPGPSDWVAWSDAAFPGAVFVTWLAGSLPMFAVIAWWVWSARQLARTP